MSYCQCFLKRKDTSWELDLGIVESISDRITIKNTAVKMPTLKAEDVFILDTGGTETYTVSSIRVNPINANDSSSDSTRWTNKKWLQQLSSAIDQWQADHDGYAFTMTPPFDSQEEQPSISANVYISSITYTYSGGVPEKVSVSIGLSVGSMYGNYSSSATKATGDMVIMLSDSSGSNWYYLLSNKNDMNCIKSYTLTGGINQPFEYIQLKIPRRRLLAYAEDLVDNDDIVAGKNHLLVNAMGSGRFLVTRCKLSNDVYTITAYAYAEAIRGATTARPYTNDYTPLAIIRDILRRGVSVGDYTINFSDTGDDTAKHTLIARVDDEVEWVGSVSFPAGTNAWYVLQVCALRLGAKVFFSEGKAYVIDTSLDSGTTNYGSITVYGDSAPDYASTFNTVDEVELGDEGTAIICNVLNVVYNNGNDTYESKSDYIAHPWLRNSVQYYGEKGERTIRIPEVTNLSDIQWIALNYMKYVFETQTSISFEVKEMNANGWNRAYPPDSRASEIIDSADDITVNNKANSTGNVHYQLLTQSTFQRNYPDGTSTYKFGALESADLTQTVSQIWNAINN